MKNIELNAGGFIGAILGGAIAAGIVFSTIDPAQPARRPYKLIVVALVGGAFAGNFLWERLVKKPNE